MICMISLLLNSEGLAAALKICTLSFLDHALEVEVKLQDRGATRVSDEELR